MVTDNIFKQKVMSTGSFSTNSFFSKRHVLFESKLIRLIGEYLFHTQPIPFRSGFLVFHIAQASSALGRNGDAMICFEDDSDVFGHEFYETILSRSCGNVTRPSAGIGFDWMKAGHQLIMEKGDRYDHIALEFFNYKWEKQFKFIANGVRWACFVDDSTVFLGMCGPQSGPDEWASICVRFPIRDYKHIDDCPDQFVFQGEFRQVVYDPVHDLLLGVSKPNNQLMHIEHRSDRLAGQGSVKSVCDLKDIYSIHVVQGLWFLYHIDGQVSVFDLENPERQSKYNTPIDRMAGYKEIRYYLHSNSNCSPRGWDKWTVDSHTGDIYYVDDHFRVQRIECTIPWVKQRLTNWFRSVLLVSR